MKNRFTEEQIIGVLKEAEVGMKVAEICRKHGISEATYHIGFLNSIHSGSALIMKITDCLRVRKFIVATALGAGLGFVSPAFGQAISYIVDSKAGKLTKLGNLGGSDATTRPEAINEFGQVAGESGGHAFITGPNGLGMTDLGGTFAHGINAAGRVAGESGGHAFITGPNGVGMADLGTLGGESSSAYGINAAGRVVGYSDTTGGPFHAFITGPNGKGMTELGALDGACCRDSQASAINATGQVAGTSATAERSTHAFITGPNGVDMTDLGTLGGSQSFALGINDAGQVVGNSYTADGSGHAFITGPNGVSMTDLGTLGGESSVAQGINDVGQVVGYSDIAGGPFHAFITGPNGKGMTDLNSLVSLPAGHVLANAFDINNLGQVIAIASISPIPEAETYAMLLAGLGLVGFIVRRRKPA